MAKQKILMVHNYYQIPGGEDTVVKNEMELLQENGHEVILYSRHNDEIKKISKFGKIKLFFDTIYSLKTYREVRKIIEEEKIDIVHVHNTLPLISPSVYYATFSKKVPIIQTVHNFRLLCPAATFVKNGEICEECVDKGIMYAVKNRCYRESFVQTLIVTLMLKIHRMFGVYKKINYIALTDFNREKLKNLVNDYEKIYVKPNFMKKNEGYAERNIGDYFLFLGRLDELKGIHTLIDAWGVLDEKLIVIGDGPERDCIERIVKEKKMKNISLKGFIEREEALEYLKRSKALIVPSEWYEGLPMTIIEAFSCGVPVIGSRIGNIEAVIEDKYNGLLFDFKDKNKLIEVVKNFESEENKLLSKSAYTLFIKNYSAKLNYEKLSEIYYKIKSANKY